VIYLTNWIWFFLRDAHKQTTACSFNFCFSGEAYIARGSYSAALKAVQRAAELNPQSTYSSYQIASIKQIMGENAEAVIAFEALLKQTPDYVPALKGLAETVLNQASEYLTDGFTGRLVDCCSKALDLLVKASRLNSHLACVWSLLGHVCLLLRSIPEDDFTLLDVPPVLLSDQNSPINKKLLMEMGPKFFLSALRILPDSAALWHNLALSYESCWMLDQAALAHKSFALAAIKKAITLAPKDSSHWDLLGQIAEQPAIRQHAFIRALELSPNAPRTAATWTHLGALYMENGDLHLAHECFKQSQNIDPFHVSAWIGQGYIAEQLSPTEAMDLFRHTSTIGSGSPGQCEGSPSYAQWVMNTLADPLAKQTAHYRYSIVEMHAVPVAIDSLVKYEALYPDDSCALNLLGLLYERQGLFTKAEAVFLKGMHSVYRHLLLLFCDWIYLFFDL
jgi:superkiller protein 3